MNKDYNRDKNLMILIFTIIIVGLIACNKKENHVRLVDTTDSCGINKDYYETIDEDTTNDGYDMDSVIYLDDKGNVIKEPLTNKTHQN